MLGCRICRQPSPVVDAIGAAYEQRTHKHSAGGEVSHSIINVGTQNQNKKTFIRVLKQGFMVYRDTLGLRTGSSMLPPTS